MRCCAMTDAAVEFVADIEKQCFSDPWSAEMLEDSRKCGLDTCLVLEDNGAVMGYCVFRIIGEEGELLRIAVLPTCRRLGYGKKLMDAMVETSRQRGVSTLFLEVRKGNETARKLYRSYGFMEEGVRRAYYRNPDEDAVLMWKKDI